MVTAATVSLSPKLPICPFSPRPKLTVPACWVTAACTISRFVARFEMAVAAGDVGVVRARLHGHHLPVRPDPLGEQERVDRLVRAEVVDGRAGPDTVPDEEVDLGDLGPVRVVPGDRDLVRHRDLEVHTGVHVVGGRRVGDLVGEVAAGGESGEELEHGGGVLSDVPPPSSARRAGCRPS